MTIICGIPQGSILGPLLFIIYINDLHLTCNHSLPYLFADDTNLFSSSKNNSADSLLQSDLTNIEEWLNANKLSLNVSKTYYMELGHRKDTANTLKIANENVTKSNCCKYLGLWIDKYLNFNVHITKVKKAISKHSGILSKIRHWVPKHILIKYYNYYIKPKIQYGILIYGCATKNALDDILVVQKKIMRTINFRPRQFTTHDLFFDNKVLTVHELHIYELLKFMLRSHRNEICSEFLNNLFVPDRLHIYNTRHSTSGNLDIPFCRTSFMGRSLKTHGTSLYNALNRAGLLPENILVLSKLEFEHFVHSFRDNVLIQNPYILQTIFCK